MEKINKILFALKNFFYKDKYFTFLSLFFFAFLILYWGRFGDPVIDCGREAYIPYAMADLGKILFKDIICIYGPVPYYLNALIIKLFGASLNTMYFIGAFLSYIFLFGIYNLAKRFIAVPLAFGFSGVITLCCIFSPSISNYIFPYSYAIVYALVFAVFHLIFMFKFVDNLDAASKAPLRYLCASTVFLALCLLSKLDFLPCVIPFLAVLLLYRKKMNLKDFTKILSSFLIPFFIVFLILIFQNVSLQNLIFNFKMISNMAHSPSLEYFYSVCTGYFFEFKKTFMFVKEFLFSSVILFMAGIFGHFAARIKNKIFSICVWFFICISGALALMFLNLVRYIFLYIPLLLLFFLVIKGVKFVFNCFKKCDTAFSKENFIFYYFLIFSVLFSLKTIFGLFHELYGTYYLPFILLSFFMVWLNVFKKYNTHAVDILKTVSFLIIVIFFIQGYMIFFNTKNFPVKTHSGNIYTGKILAGNINKTVEFLQNNLKNNETVLVLPEGLFINFVLKKDSPYFNTSFTPLDFDAYGEEYLTNEVLANMPKYIVFMPRNFQDYNKSYICVDFGMEFCSKINEKYVFKTKITSGNIDNQREFPVQIFERKDND